MSKEKVFKSLTVGRLIQAIVEYRGMTICEFGNSIGEHPMNVYKIFNGGRKITNDLAAKMGKALNVNPVIIVHAAALDKFGVVNTKNESNEEN